MSSTLIEPFSSGNSRDDNSAYQLFQQLLEANASSAPPSDELRNNFANALIRMAAKIAMKRSKSFANTTLQGTHNIMDFDTCFSAAMGAVVKILEKPSQYAYAADDEKAFHQKCKSLMNKQITEEWRYLTHRGKTDQVTSFEHSLDMCSGDGDQKIPETEHPSLAVHDTPDRASEMAHLLNDRLVPNVKQIFGEKSKTYAGIEGLAQACREHIEKREVAARLGITPSALSQQQSAVRKTLAAHAPYIEEEFRAILAEQDRSNNPALSRGR